MRQQQGTTGVPLSLFISYAHEDEPLRQQLETHLSLLQRQGLIASWHDRQILAGDERAQEINQHLEGASIILLLISASFLASDYCYDIEMKRALERHQRGEARVIPIILRPCDWQASPFARLQCLPHYGSAVTTWQNSDEAFLAIAEGLRLIIERQQIPALPHSEVERKNRTRLIKRVRAMWITGVLERSLHQAALIALDLQEQPDALANPWHLEVQETNQPPRSFPAGTSIVEVYDKSEGELLLLGEAGAGKTTLLLELARTLLEKAEQEENHCIPVVFNLSSWANKQQLLSEWLTEELNAKYQVPHKIAQVWVDADQILPLLDGLDEVKPVMRSACVDAINHYLQEHNLGSMVVCSRRADYLVQKTRVLLQSAVVVQPLTPQQIDEYLMSAGEKLTSLREALQDDPRLQELSKTPLMLNVLTLTYQERPVNDLLAEGSPQTLLQEVFAVYVQRMFEHRRAVTHYTQQQSIHRLAWLARQMAYHNQTVFYIERLQPNWLSESQFNRLHRSGVAKLIYKLTYGLIYGLSAWLLGENFGVIIGLILGLVVLLASALLNIDNSYVEPAEFVAWSWTSVWRSLSTFSVNRLIWGLVTGLVFGLIEGLRMGPVSGLESGLVSALFSYLYLQLWRSLEAGLSSGLLDEHELIRPNEGIWRSARNSTFVALFAGLVIAFWVWFFSRLGFYFFFSNALLTGLATGLVVWLPSGGDAWIGHFILRLFLWYDGSVPWNYSRFLDYAAERILLRKVGGGYIFIHRLLLDYFAALETQSFEKVSTGSALLQKRDENE